MSPGTTNKESGVLPCVNRYFLFFVSSVGSHLERALCNYSSIYCEALSKKKKKKKSLPQSKSLKSFPLEVGSYFYHTCCCQILWYISRILAFFECHVSSVQRLNICQFAKILLRIFFFLFRLKNFNWIVL